MITGSITPDGVPVVTPTVAGTTWTAIIDTGFNGDLELPSGLQPFVNAQVHLPEPLVAGGGADHRGGHLCR